ncbi:uncharacterized protein CXorf65 homolog [Ctenodactylus gundi]
MYIYIKYRDNQELLANPECTILVLIDYIRRKLGLPKKAIIDLCDEAGAMKLFFLSKTPREYASKFLTDQETYYVCRVRRAGRGTGLQNAYRAIVPILKNPEPAMLGKNSDGGGKNMESATQSCVVEKGLRTQCEILERSRVKMLKILEAKRLAAIESAMLLQAKVSVTWHPTSSAAN